MAIRYITDKNTDYKPNPVQKATPQPAPVAPPAPLPPAPPVVNLNEISSKKQALQNELNAIQAAEQARLNAEAEAARKQARLQQEIADLERAERQAVITDLVASGQRITAGSTQNAAKLEAELEKVVSAIENLTADVGIRATFLHFSEVVSSAAAHAVDAASLAKERTASAEDRNKILTIEDISRAKANAIAQFPAPPITLPAALKNWIKAAKNEREKTTRVGIALAITGVLFSDIPPAYNPTEESRSTLKALVNPRTDDVLPNGVLPDGVMSFDQYLMGYSVKSR